MNDLGYLHIILIVLLSFVASGVSTAIGFGLNIILVSFLQFFVPPVQLVGLAIIVGTMNAAIRTVETRQIQTAGVSWRLVLPGILAIPAGLMVLCFADIVFLKRFFSVIILASSTLLLVSRRETISGKKNNILAHATQILLGAVGGFVGASSGMPGPPIVFCSLIQRWEKMLAHAVFARFFLVTGIISGTTLFVIGRYEHRTIITGLSLLPVVLAGFFVGTWLRNRISQQQFQRYTMICLILLAIGTFLNTLYNCP